MSGIAKTWLLLVLITVSGCMGTKPPIAIQQASDLKRTAITNYAANVDRILNTLLDGYRSEAYARIDTLAKIDMETGRQAAAASGGKVDFAQATAFMDRLQETKESKRREVDASISKIREIMAGASVDLALNLKLDEVVQRYADAGIDLSAAQTAIDQILAIIQQARAK